MWQRRLAHNLTIWIALTDSITSEYLIKGWAYVKQRLPMQNKRKTSFGKQCPSFQITDMVLARWKICVIFPAIPFFCIFFFPFQPDIRLEWSAVLDRDRLPTIYCNLSYSIVWERDGDVSIFNMPAKSLSLICQFWPSRHSTASLSTPFNHRKRKFVQLTCN